RSVRGAACQKQGNRSSQAFRGFGNVDRFFSKLDLRDIKIDPFKASYPPDADEAVEAAPEYGVEAEIAPRPFGGSRQPHTPAWASPTEQVSANGYADGDQEESYSPNGAHAPDGAY